MQKIAVDLTPLLSGGANGGAKPMVLALLRKLPLIMPEFQFVLLTNSESHDELSVLDRENVSRYCIYRPSTGKSPDEPASQLVSKFGMSIFPRLRAFFLAKLPARMILFLKQVKRNFEKPQYLFSQSFLKSQNIDLLFCPFTAPEFRDPYIPTVSIIYDLQFVEYPQFFDPDDLMHRRQSFEKAIRVADHLVTISSFVRQTVLQNSSVPPDKITPILIGQVQDFPNPAADFSGEVLARLSVVAEKFLLFPANFWAHKNHSTLLIAYQMYLSKNPQSDVKLVCTGALDDRKSELIRIASVMGLGDRVVFPGFLSDQEMGVLYKHALALLFPSLYEGFGIPLLEAFSAGIPVACSNTTSLPEVGGDAAYYFNPHSPKEIAKAIEKITLDNDLRNQLIAKGYERLTQLGDVERMALEYAQVLRETLSCQRDYQYDLIGVTPDFWLQDFVDFTYPDSNEERIFEMSVDVPEWSPFPVVVECINDGKRINEWHLPRARRTNILVQLPKQSSHIRFLCAPTFVPVNLGIGSDTRNLSVRFMSCWVKDTAGKILFEANNQP